MDLNRWTKVETKEPTNTWRQSVFCHLFQDRGGFILHSQCPVRKTETILFIYLNRKGYNIENQEHIQKSLDRVRNSYPEVKNLQKTNNT